MRALRNIHSVLVPNGLLVDTQPVSARPRVAVDGAELGRLDMREWIATIRAIDERVDETISLGLYELDDERELVVASVFDDGPDCLRAIGGWQGTRLPVRLGNRLAAVRGEVVFEQHVRLRVFRRTPVSARPAR